MNGLHALSIVSALLLASADASAPPPSHPAPPVAQSVATGVWLIPGAIPPNREPDGNTVVFRTPRGLIVMDTGRHVWHRQAILAFAKAQGRPIVAIVNSHWHLDHVSGNPDLKHAYPAAKVYASNAIDGALKGFLPKSAQQMRAMLAAGRMPPETTEDVAGDVATMANGEALRPDVVVTASGARVIGGLRLEVNLATNAATQGDVWVFDRRTRVAAVGDLVTLPAPFLDTACAAGWRRALDRIWATPFTLVIPGHGAPMSRAQFGVYRSAFGALIDCAASKREPAACAQGWTQATASLRDPATGDAAQAQSLTEYYVHDVLRANGGDSQWCRTYQRKT